MKINTCKQCNNKFAYCRACVFRPVAYKDRGFCSQECYDKFINKPEEVIPTEDVEVVVIEEDTSTPTESAIEYPYFFTATEEEIKEEVEECEIEEKEENENDDYEQNYGEELSAD